MFERIRQRQTALGHAERRRAGDDSDVTALLHLQGLAGNAAVGSIVLQRRRPGEPDEDPGAKGSIPVTHLVDPGRPIPETRITVPGLNAPALAGPARPAETTAPSSGAPPLPADVEARLAGRLESATEHLRTGLSDLYLQMHLSNRVLALATLGPRELGRQAAEFASTLESAIGWERGLLDPLAGGNAGGTDAPDLMNELTVFATYRLAAIPDRIAMLTRWHEAAVGVRDAFTLEATRIAAEAAAARTSPIR